MHYDVAIVGGGPAGSTTAGFLRKYGQDCKVIVLEREKFPRDHVGESQLPPISRILDELGVWDKIEAANLASLLIAVRSASPTNLLLNFAVPPLNINSSSTNYISSNGMITNQANASYRIVCSTATNSLTGSSLAQLYIALNWPPQESLAVPSAKHYEILTYIPLP